MLLLLEDVVRTSTEAIAVGSVSMTLARSRMFREARWWVHRHMGEKVWDLAKCPWCMSHWLAFITVAICGPIPLSSWWTINWLLSSFLVVAIAPVAGFMVHRVYSKLPPVPTQVEWDGEWDAFDALPKEHQ